MPYLSHIQQTLPRVLASFDADRTRASHGYGDRVHWAWGLSDFANGSLQGAAHGLSLVWRSGRWPFATTRAAFLARIDAIFSGTARQTRSDGSLDEAFPREGSWCVTAHVACDLLCALDLLDEELDAGTRSRWQQIVHPLAGHLLHHDETHAFISNHLVTGAAALVRWYRLTGDEATARRARQLVDRVLERQSEEGWFTEYQGADPGYQSLATSYLADIHRLRPDWALEEPLRRSIQFLWCFAHPDGSFGGLYGSRCTRFYYPAGVEILAGEIPEAAALAGFMRGSIRDHRVVTLAAMDAGNLVPMFNDYCRAAVEAARSQPPPELPPLPALTVAPIRRVFPGAGLVVDRGPHHYTIVSTAKGGVTVHFKDGQLAILDAGVVVRDRRGRLGSTQAFAAGRAVQLSGERLIVDASITAMSRQLPRPWQFVLLRVLSATLFRVAALRAWVKRRLVGALITADAIWPVKNRRTITLGPGLVIEDALEQTPGYTRVPDPGAFVAIHMASQGYWQAQDET